MTSAHVYKRVKINDMIRWSVGSTYTPLVKSKNASVHWSCWLGYRKRFWAPITTTFLRPLHPVWDSLHYPAPTAKSWMILLSRSFTARMTLLTAT